jgi:hypothetical protein
MPKCKNDPSKNYEGNEPSPKGLGICAHAEKINSKKKGMDGNMWTVAETKNGVKRWIKYKKQEKKQEKYDALSLENYYGIPNIPLKSIPKHMYKHDILKKIYEKIIPEIQKHKINFFIVLLPRSKHNGIYWSDYANSYLTETYGDEILNKESYMDLTVYLYEDLSIDLGKNPIINYKLEKPEQQIVADIFIKHLPYNYSWDGNDLKLMEISYDKNKTKMQKVKLDDRTNYPVMIVTVHVQTKSVDLFDLDGFQHAKELKNLDKILLKAKYAEYGYGKNDFMITFNGVKGNEKRIKDYFDKIKKGGTLSFGKTVLKITKIDITK